MIAMLNRDPCAQNPINAGYLPILFKYPISTANRYTVMLAIRIKGSPAKASRWSWRVPIPQIVLFQREDGVLELIDGLQRVSSIIRFITGRTPHEAEEDQDQTAILVGCDIVPSLNGKLFGDLEPVLQLELKRKALRAIVIRRTNDPNLRYEMFKRLNAGGSPAEAHEVRNASLRIVGPTGEAFLRFLDECSKQRFFEELTDTLSEQAKHRLGSQELVLRFFALKNSMETYKGSISDWLDDYSEAVAKGVADFDYDRERPQFNNFFDLLAAKLGSGHLSSIRAGEH